MNALDHSIAGLSGRGTLMALLVAVLLGLRHATDPDHLTAVSTLVMSDGERGTRRAGRLGLAWGAGHALTLCLFGLPVVLFHGILPEPLQRLAEVIVGIVIIALALRLIVRWRRGLVHVHPHRHGDRWHSHPHAHELVARHHEAHDHAHPESLGRSPRAAFGIGLVHGLGGSAAVGLLVIGAVRSRPEAAVALVLFAGATMVSMAVLSTGFGRILGRAASSRGAQRLFPALGTLSLAFGAWYMVVAL